MKLCIAQYMMCMTEHMSQCADSTAIKLPITHVHVVDSYMISSAMIVQNCQVYGFGEQYLLYTHQGQFQVCM